VNNISAIFKTRTSLSIELGLWCCHFQLYFSYIRFISGGTWRKSLTCLSQWQILSHDLVLNTPCQEQELYSQL